MQQVARTFLSCKPKTPYSLNNAPGFPAFPKSLVMTILFSLSMNLTTLDNSCQVELYSICHFVTTLFHLAQCPQESSLFLHVTRFLSFLRISNIPFYVYTTLCLFIYQLMDFGIVSSTYWLL